MRIGVLGGKLGDSLFIITVTSISTSIITIGIVIIVLVGLSLD